MYAPGKLTEFAVVPADVGNNSRIGWRPRGDGDRLWGCDQRRWGNALTWTPSSAFPGSSDRAFIGSNYPGGSAGTANVSLGADQSVNSLYVGYGSVTDTGTLNLAGHKLNVGSQIDLGYNGGSGTIVEGGGSFSTPSLYLYSGNSLALGASDTVASLYLSTSSLLTTAAGGNVAGLVSLDLGTR